MKLIFLFVFVSFAIACETSPEVENERPSIKNEHPTSVPPKNSATEPKEQTDAKAFGAFIDGADTIELMRIKPDGTPPTTRILRDDLVTQAINLIGKDVMASNAVPKCIGMFQVTFKKGDDKIASFSSICTSESTILSNGTVSFAAQDGAGLKEFLERESIPKRSDGPTIKK